MRKILLVTLGAVAITAASTEFAAAGPWQQARKSTHATTERLRNSNAAWTQRSPQPDIYNYSGGFSAPAGR